jgi:hypothetical protein
MGYRKEATRELPLCRDVDESAEICKCGKLSWQVLSKPTLVPVFSVKKSSVTMGACP